MATVSWYSNDIEDELVAGITNTAQGLQEKKDKHIFLPENC